MISGVQIPTHWRWTRFGDVGEVVSDLVDPMLTPGAFHIAPNHIESWTGKLLPFATVADDGVKSPKHQFWPGQILYSKIRPYLAKAALATFKGVCSADMYPIAARIDPRFLLHWILTPWFTGETARNQGRTILPKINRNALDRLPVPVAPMSEQCRIVAKIEELFSDLDAGVTALKRAKANIKRYRAAVLKAAIEGKLTEAWRSEHPDTEPASKLLGRILTERRKKWEADQLAKFAVGDTPNGWREKYAEPTPPDMTGLPELPEGWCWASVEQCASDDEFAITDGPFGSNLKTEHYTDDGPRVIRLQNIGDGVFIDEDAFISWHHFSTLKRHSVKPNDIVIAMLGERLPRACLIPAHIPPAIVKADCVKLSPNKAVVEPSFLVTVFNAHPTRARAAGKIAGVGRPRLNLGKLRPIAIPLPPRDEQFQIVAEVGQKISQIDASATAIERALLRAGRLRQSILKQAFGGKLVPQDPNDEPADALLERLRASRSAHDKNGKAAASARFRSRRAKVKQNEVSAYE